MTTPQSAKILTISRLLAIRRKLAQEGKRIVFTNGCFDLLHIGHIHCLQQARRLGDCLVVAVNDDASARQLKGPTRPLMLARERAAMLAALECVDFVVIFHNLTAERLVAQLRPEIYVKGGDYGFGVSPPEAAVAERYGGQVVFIPYLRGYSTTELIQRIRSSG